MNYRNLKPSGLPDACTFVVVSGSPGKEELSRNEPMCGQAGRLFTELLTKAKIPRADCYVTKVIKTGDMPPSHFFSRTPKKGVTETSEFQMYLKLLQDELKHTKGIILAVGNLALYALTGRWGIYKWRGSILYSTLLADRIVIPIIHPETLVRHWDADKHKYVMGMFKNKLLIQNDLNRAYELHSGTLMMRSYDIRTAPTYTDCMSFLAQCYSAGLKGEVVDYDIEIKNMQVSCISFALDNIAISIPFIDNRGDYFPLPQEAELWLKIAQILEHPSIRVRGQNITFDAHFNLRRYGINACNFDDTMIAQRILMPEYPIGLDFITSIWTTHPYYKDDGKAYFEGGNWPRLWRYNATDSLICSEAHPKQMIDMAKQGNELTYERQRRLIEPLVFMMEKGIRVNALGMRKAYVDMMDEVSILRDKLDIMAGQPLNPNSPKQLKEYFYNTLGHKGYKKKGKITTDDDAMKRLSIKGVKEAHLVQQIRTLRKAASTYLDIEKVDEDGYYRCSYNPVGTRYARLSSSSNIFGTGGNMQNWPHNLLNYLLPDRDHVYYSFDLAQAENRIVAYVGRVTPMIQAFEQELDLHCLTAGLIFGKPSDEISREPGSSTLGNGTHSERDWGKKTNHGLNYDFGYKSFGLLYEIPERQAKFIVEKYHSIYPGVRNNFHAYIRKCLSENRTLTNLMGRRTLFLDEWGDSLFKEAYSCIPQGTVGDLINERGLEFVYYDQKQFKELALLVQVHDSIGFQLPLSLPMKEHARMILSIKASLEQPLTFQGQSFIVPADLTYGYSLGKKLCREIGYKKFPTDIDTLAEQLTDNLKEMEQYA